MVWGKAEMETKWKQETANPLKQPTPQFMKL